ncbi:MAG: KpsF/GutQ family sugar-phosphate isomerase [Rikenellaceae bacterium]|nr:KpsF/GutQ family sugar-phosphate isomerase [Rikenellaceae bacterium]
MSDFKEIKEFAVEAIDAEIEAVKRLPSFIDDEFAGAVECMFAAKGRIIITGIGKSAIIATKIVATLNSTGTPAVFMHAADAIHGDLGMIQNGDVVICISNSGDSPEIKVLVPLIRNIGDNKVVAMVGRRESTLGKLSDYVIITHVDGEACPNNLAPTSSTTAQLVMGDAIAMTLLRMRGFTSEDYAKVHPGGALGKKLYMRVGDILSTQPAPQVSTDAGIDQVIFEISSKFQGATAVIENDGSLAGIITDGDIRRMLQKSKNFNDLTARDVMSLNPKTTDKEELAVKAFNKMEQNKITQLVVMDNGKYCGMIHIHDILREGLV